MERLIQNITDLHKNRLKLLQQEVNPKIGWLSIYTPEEIVYAAGLIPFRLTGETVTSTSKAGAYMHRNICSYVLSCFEEGLQDTISFADGIVITNACDARRRLYDVWRYYLKTKYIYLFDLPKVINHDSLKYFTFQMQKFISSLEDHYNCKITENLLLEAINVCNETRALLNQLYELRKKNVPPISGSIAINIIKASMSGLKQEFNKRLAELLSEIRLKEPVSDRNKHRVLICGSYFDYNNLIELIENLGVLVVCEDISTGIKYFEGAVDTRQDPVTALASYYLEKATCARMLDQKKRFDHLWSLIENYHVNSVIYFNLKFCDNNIIDFAYQKRQLTEKGIPVLLLEGERFITNTEQLKTRINAFFESQLMI